MPPPSSSRSSDGHAFASSQGNAFASSQGKETFSVRVATYNIGAQEEHFFTGKLLVPFTDKFYSELQQLCARADVICLQEVSEFWAERVRYALSNAWEVWHMDHKAIIYHNDKVEMQLNAWCQAFPEARPGSGRAFRGYLLATRV